VHDTFAGPAIVKAVAALRLMWGGLTIASSLVSTVLLNSTAGACAPNDHSGLCIRCDSSGRLIVIGSTPRGSA
jgi:hypothetical protein